MPKIEINEERNKTIDEKIKTFCGTCNTDTNHISLQTVDVLGSEIVRYGSGKNDVDSVEWSDHYQIIKCLGCDSYSFRHKSWFSEDQYQTGPYEYYDGINERFYPKRGKNVIVAKEFFNVPRNLRTIYMEVINCYNNDSPILCAAGLRASIEGLCEENNIADGPVQIVNEDGSKQIVRKSNLEGKISGLAEKGILTKMASDILHEHRFIGNQAVHELSKPSDAGLRTAIEIVEHLLESVYEIPEKAELLRRARNKK